MDLLPDGPRGASAPDGLRRSPPGSRVSPELELRLVTEAVVAIADAMPAARKPETPALSVLQQLVKHRRSG